MVGRLTLVLRRYQSQNFLCIKNKSNLSRVIKHANKTPGTTVLTVGSPRSGCQMESRHHHTGAFTPAPQLIPTPPIRPPLQSPSARTNRVRVKKSFISTRTSRSGVLNNALSLLNYVLILLCTVVFTLCPVFFTCFMLVLSCLHLRATPMTNSSFSDSKLPICFPSRRLLRFLSWFVVSWRRVWGT